MATSQRSAQRSLFVFLGTSVAVIVSTLLNLQRTIQFFDVGGGGEEESFRPPSIYISPGNLPKSGPFQNQSILLQKNGNHAGLAAEASTSFHAAQTQSTVTTPSVRATIAYAVSITGCQGHFDGAAVLKHSIHLNSARNPASGSHYDYQMVAFVHPVAENCSASILRQWDYQIRIRETPIHLKDIRGGYRAVATRAGCCGEKEWLKLYSYTLLEFPIVVHLDLDCLVLQPLDSLFDAMMEGLDSSSRARIPAMWINHTEHTGLPSQIDAFFTRDYNLVKPGKRKPSEIGVQGGFLVIRPNQTVFEEYVELILEGNYTPSFGWGSPLKYGGYYGAATIQGLAAYFYGHLYPERAVELNRCVYNSMVDIPYSSEGKCRTTQDECEDCRASDLASIKSVHFTVCWKPWKCAAEVPTVWQNGTKDLCLQIHHEWFRVRQALEVSLGQRKGSIAILNDTQHMSQRTLGYCHGQKYSPILVPNIQ